MRKTIKIFIVVLISILFILCGNSFATTAEDNIQESSNVEESYVMVGETFIISQGTVQDFVIDGVTYDESKNILTLNNFTGTSIYIQNKTISIEVLGTNTLQPENATAFQSNNNIDTIITLKGTGTLNMTSVKEDVEVLASYGGDGGTNLVIDGPTVNVTGYNCAIHGIGIEVKNGMLMAKCTDNISSPIPDEYLPKYGDNMQYIDNDSTIIIKEHTTIANKDNETNIKLDATTKELPEDIEIFVDTVTSGEIYNSVIDILNDIASKVYIYDISLMQNDTVVQPNGNVKISIPVPSNIDTSKVIVYRITEDSEKIEYTTTLEIIDNITYAIFETDHFSTYVLAEKKVVEEQQEEQEKQPEQEQQPDNTQTEQEVDDTVAQGVLPKAGIGISIITFLFAVVMISIFTFTKYNKMKDIK